MTRAVLSSERTLRECRRLGWIAGKVERFIPSHGGQGHGVRVDLFGFIDVLAIQPEDAEFLAGLLAIQSCSMSGRAAHMDKLLEPDVAGKLKAWLSTGNAAEMWAWRKLKRKRGGLAVRWTVERTPLKAPLAEGKE